MKSPSSRKRKLRLSYSMIDHTSKIIDNELDAGSSEKKGTMESSAPTIFHAKTTIADANKLTDGIKLRHNNDNINDNINDNNVILPCIGYGTYKLGKEIAREKTLEALRQGYRCIDTAFIYGGETTEKQVGLAIEGRTIIEYFCSLIVLD